MATTETASSPPSAGREALEAHRWQEAFDLLTQTDRERALGPDDLEALAQAAWFSAQPDLALEAKERAFKAQVDAGNKTRAAFLAFDIFRDYGIRRELSVASAWLNRGERLIEGDQESYAHGYQALARSMVAQSMGEIDLGIELAARAVELGAKHGDHDLQAWGLVQQGSMLITAGRTEEGFRLLEEATVAAVNGELSPFTAGVAYCQMIAAARNTTDYRRAGEWTEAARRWCERQAINGFPGVCRIHRAEIEGLQGGFERAEQELRQATAELSAYRAGPPLADGFYALGEIRLRMGDLEAAEDTLRQAHSLGHTPYPALALIRLGEGKVRAALTAISTAVEELKADQWTTVRLLPAQIEIAVAAGEVGTARQAAERLEELSRTFDSPALHASTHGGWGRVLLAEGEPGQAIRELRDAIRSWREVPAPYEVAKDRVVLAAALRELERDDEAELEMKTAKAEFDGLGAVRDAGQVIEALKAEAERRSAPTATHKTFLFTDIVGSTSLAEAMGDEAWEHLLRWHDDTLRSLFARHGGEVANSTGDGFFAAFDSPGRSIECAFAVQRALAEHRSTHGFAPRVRIGVHSAEATRREGGYSGVGVHVAARIAALAEGGQVLASASTASAAGAASGSDRRAVSLKGVSEPVEIVTLAWN